LVSDHITTRRHKSEDPGLNLHRRGNLKSRIILKDCTPDRNYNFLNYK